MKKYIISFLVIFAVISNAAYAQKIKTKKRVEKQKGYLEEYYVLKKDKTVKHGPYKKLSYSKRVLEKGQYINGSKSGIWISYYKNGKKRLESSYTDDKPSGKWKYYDTDGNIDQIYDQDNDKVDFNKEITPLEYFVKKGNRYVKTLLDDPPYYIGGFSSMTYFISQNITYPKKDREKNISGTVKISFIVTKDGTIVNYDVEEGLSKACDKEALRVVEMISGEWKPAIYNGKAVDVKLVLPIVFRLDFMTE